MRLLSVGMLAAVVLTGCSTIDTAPIPDAGPPPADYRKTVADNVRTTFFDPYTVRDASISQLLYSSAVFDGITPIPRKGWIVCIRANAKNKMDAYIGQELTVMLFNRGNVDLSISGPDFQGQIEEDCATAVYSPFPGIEQKGT